MTERYNDFTIDAAVDWLENADRDKFDKCRKDITEGDGWFDWFVKDRQSLGKVKSRIFVSRQELPCTSNGLKRYELKFVASYSTMPQETYEQLMVETDCKSSLSVISASYWLYSFKINKKSGRTPSDKEKIVFNNIAENILKKVDARETAYFQQAYTEWAQQPDYFHFNSQLAAEAKSLKNLKELYRILSQSPGISSKQWQLTKMPDLFSPAGRTGFECCNIGYAFSVNTQGKISKYQAIIAVDRDLYQDKNAAWNFFGLWYWEVKEEKKK